jgi:hypothetical protein
LELDAEAALYTRKMSAAASSDEAQTWTCPACTLVNESADRCCAACGRLRPGAEAVVVDHAACEEAVVALALEAGGPVVGPEEQQPKRGTKSFAHLPNGDCMPHALALGTHYLLDRLVVKNADHTSIAAQMRSMLHAHMERNWLSCCAVAGGLPWHTLITLAHNAAVNEVERAQYDDSSRRSAGRRSARTSTAACPSCSRTRSCATRRARR